MVKEIIWSKSAENKFLSILEFWYNNNRSNQYSDKLVAEFSQRITIISSFPEIGINCNVQGVKFTLIEHYRMYYQLLNDKVRIVFIWDTRQDPAKNKYNF